MKYFTQILLLSFCIITPVSAYADGNRLLKECNAAIQIFGGKLNKNNLSSISGGAHCIGLLEGIAALNTIDPQSTYYCVPQDSNALQQVTVVTKYLNSHPEDLHKSDTSLVVSAYKEAFPCDK
ncbi:MAG: Rap1a/Tai family immunity protein [Desulfotalea sp.]